MQTTMKYDISPIHLTITKIKRIAVPAPHPKLRREPRSGAQVSAARELPGSLSSLGACCPGRLEFRERARVSEAAQWRGGSSGASPPAGLDGGCGPNRRGPGHRAPRTREEPGHRRRRAVTSRQPLFLVRK